MLMIHVFPCCMSLAYAQEEERSKTILRTGFTHYPPIQIYDWRTSTFTGSDVEFIEEIEKVADVEIKVDYVPWKRLLVEVEKGNYQIIFSVVPTEERLSWADATAPYYKVKIRLFLNKDFKRLHKIESLEDLERVKSRARVGILDSWIYSEKSQKINSSASLKNTVARDDNLLVQMEMGRIDFAILHEKSAKSHIRTLELKKITSLKDEFEDLEYVILISKKVDEKVRNELIQKINKLIKKNNPL